MKIAWACTLAAFWALADVGIYFRYATLGPMVDIVFALAFALLPMLFYAAVRAPLLFPFCAYVLILPFDSLSRVSDFGTLAKILGILCAVAAASRLIQSRRILPIPRVVLAWIALLVWMGITLFWAPNGAEATSSLQQYASLIALLTILAVSPITRTELSGILVSIVAAGAFSSAYQIYLFRSGQAIVNGAARVELDVGSYRIDPNDFASSLVLPVAIAFYALFACRSRYARVAAVAALVLLFGGLGAAASRGAILSTLLMLGYEIVRSRHRIKFVLLVGLAASLTLVFNPGVIARFQQASDGEGAGRSDIWRTGLYAFRQHWLAGWGIGGFPDAYDANHLNVFAGYLGGWHWYPHSSVVSVLTELGVVGFAIWIVALVAQFRLASVVGPRSDLYELRVALEGAFLGVFLAGCFTTNSNEKYTWLAYATLLFLRGYEIGRAPAPSADEPRPDWKIRSAEIAARLRPRGSVWDFPFPVLRMGRR